MNDLGWDCQANTLPKPGFGIYILCWRRQGLFPSFLLIPFLNRSRSLCIDWRRHVPGTYASTYSYHSPPRKRIFTSCTVVYSIWSYFLLLLLDIAASERWLDGIWRLLRRLWNVCWIWWKMTRPRGQVRFRPLRFKKMNENRRKDILLFFLLLLLFVVILR